jgi:hypothetical protein
LALAGAVLALAAAGAAAHDAPSPQGQVLSFTCGALPQDAGFDVIPYSDRDLNLEIARALAAELGKRAHAVAPGERFEATLDASVERGVVEAPSRSLGRLKIKKLGVEVRFNVWSSSEDSLLARRRREPPRETTYLLVTVKVRDRQTAKALWSGEATGELRGRPPAVVGRALMPALAEALDCSLSLDEAPSPKR